MRTRREWSGAASAILMVLAASALHAQSIFIKDKDGLDIYHDAWIDFNKNGRKDVYEDPEADPVSRVEDLLAQMAYNR